MRVSNMSNILKLYAKKKETPIQLNYLYNNNYSLIKKQTEFLKEELSIRLSHRIFDLLKLPYGLPLIPEIKTVINLYHNSFEKINKYSKFSLDIEDFTNTLKNIKDKHNNLEYTIAQGIKRLDDPLIDHSIINNVLDTFFLSRISIRTLISHQIRTVNKQEPIITMCNINYIIEDAIQDIKYLSDRYFDYMPDFKVNTIYNNNDNNSDIYILYIKSHLYYIFGELLKNSVFSHSKYNI